MHWERLSELAWSEAGPGPARRWAVPGWPGASSSRAESRANSESDSESAVTQLTVARSERSPDLWPGPAGRVGRRPMTREK